MKMKKILFSLACAALAFIAAAEPTRTELLRQKLASGDRNYVFVAMHRGDWRNYPENSRDAILSCIKLGADIVELDARMTKDGHFVLLHDDRLDRTSNGKGKVKDHTLAEIKKLKLKANQGGKNAAVTDYEILTLEEALALTRGKILVNIDKFTAHPHEILDTVKRIGALKEVLVKSTHSAEQAKGLFKEYWTNVESGELLYMPVVQFCWGRQDHAAKILPTWLAIEPRATSMYEICLESEKFLPELKKVAQAKGAPRIWINTMWEMLDAKHEDKKALKDPDANWGWCIREGATMLQTDYGKEMLEYLTRIGRHTLTK